MIDKHLFPFFDTAPGFAWGRHDCALFVAAWVRHMTGIDYASAWRGRYRSMSGAVKQIKAHGGLKALVASVWGEPVSMFQARRGDVVLFESDQGPTLGIHAGTAVAAVGKSGVVFRTVHAGVAWRLGFEIPAPEVL